MNSYRLFEDEDYRSYRPQYNMFDDDLYQRRYSKRNFNNDYKVNLTVIVDFDGQDEEFFETGTTKPEAWMKFFFNNPSICFDNIVDYEYS